MRIWTLEVKLVLLPEYQTNKAHPCHRSLRHLTLDQVQHASFLGLSN